MDSEEEISSYEIPMQHYHKLTLFFPLFIFDP